MLVDDDSVAAQMYAVGLEAGGFRVSVMGEPAALFEALERELPDVLVLEYRLPGTSGADVLDLLRKNARTAQLRVFILSNFLGDQDGAVDRVFAAGALAWLRKPLTPPNVLIRRLQQAIGPSHYGRRTEDRS